LVLGMGAGIGMGALREFSDDAVRNGDSLSRETRFPVLAGIPVITTDKDIARRRRIRLAWAGGALGVIALGMVVFHLFVMDLNIFWAKLMRKLAL
jgi:succinoglycan biosynthesis transport protein ExoP